MGLICLQGGNEFAPACRDMDAYLVERAGGGPVVLLPLAAPKGGSYDTTGRNGATYLAALGAKDVLVAPDAREDMAAAVHAVERTALLVIPGGSPRRLRDAVRGTPLHEAVKNAAADEGRVVMGSSAGAMVLCAWTVLPEDRVEVEEGLGVVADFAVIPHFDGTKPDWEHALAGRGDVLGIPECSGVLLDGENVTATGREAATLIGDDVRGLLAAGG
jgi:peptidase E